MDISRSLDLCPFIGINMAALLGPVAYIMLIRCTAYAAANRTLCGSADNRTVRNGECNSHRVPLMQSQNMKLMCRCYHTFFAHDWEFLGRIWCTCFAPVPLAAAAELRVWSDGSD